MRKLYLFIGIIFYSVIVSAQLSLTKAVNEPVIGNVNTKQLYDSVGIIPKNSGVNQLWDFSAFTINPQAEVSTYIGIGSAPYGTSYTGASYAESDGQGNYNFFKSSATKLEVVGIQTPDVRLNFSSSVATAFVWPITMGYAKSDAFSGTAVANSLTGSVNGNLTTLASGTGTLIIPGGAIFTGVLQVKITQSAIASFAFGIVTANFKAIDYSYFHASQKFPILTVSYQNVQGAASSNSAKVKLNSAAIVGINDLNFDASFNIFPNPARDNIYIKLNNASNTNCSVEIINDVGQVTKFINLGNDTDILNTISISDLESGIYIVKTSLGDKMSVRKLIVE